MRRILRVMMDMNEFRRVFLALVITISSVDGDLCEPNPCKNNGICIDVNKEINCICEDHLIGPRCEKDPCEPNPCEHDGLCETTGSTFSCSCSSLYAGATCETVIDGCHINPCMNEGVCRMYNGQYVCLCKNPYTGKNCDKMATKFDEDSSIYEPSSQLTTKKSITILNSIKPEYLEVTTMETILPNIEISTSEMLNNNKKLTDTTINDENGSVGTSTPEVTVKIISSESTEIHATTKFVSNIETSTLEVSNMNSKLTDSPISDESSSQETEMTTINVVKLKSSVPASFEIPATKTFHPNIGVSTSEESNKNVKLTDPTIGEKSSYKTSSYEMTATNSLKLSSHNPESSTDTTLGATHPNFEVSTVISEKKIKITDRKSSFTEPSNLGTITMNLVTTSIDPGHSITSRSFDLNLASSTMGQSRMIISTVSSITDNLIIKTDKPKKQASTKTALYVCGAIGAVLGFFLFLVGVVHFSKRLKIKKQTHSFQSLGSTSISNEDSVSILV